MQASATIPDFQPPKDIETVHEDEHRRFQRVRVDLLGRYMLPDRREFVCQVSEMSPGGAVLLASHAGHINDKIIAYIDHIGRVEGYVRRTYPGGFMMSVEANAAKREKLAEQLTWLANRSMLGMSDERANARVVPQRRHVTVMPLGQPRMPGKVVDISVTGFAIESNVTVQVGDIVYVNKTLARVVRDIGIGFAAEFGRNQANAHLLELATDLGVDQMFAGL